MKNEGQKPIKRISTQSPYMDVEIYNNYTQGMKDRNKKRKKQGLDALHGRTFQEWLGEP